MIKEEFEALCYDNFISALDMIQENAPEDYATIEREEFAAVAFRVFSQGVFMGYNLCIEKMHPTKKGLTIQ